MTKREFTKNASLYQKQIREAIKNILDGAGPEYADGVYKMLVGYAKGAGIWYVEPGTTYDVPGNEELQGVADALGVHAEPLNQFIQDQGGLTTEACDWSTFEDGVRLYVPE